MLDLNALLFEGKQFTQPEEYLAQFERVAARVAGMKVDSANGELVATVQRLMPKLLEELEASVRQAASWAKVQAEDANSARANGELKKFSPRERKMFAFSGVTPHDQALNHVAENQNAAIVALPALIEKFVAGQQQAPAIDWRELGKGIAKGLKESGVVAVKPDEAKADNKSGKQR